MKFYFPQWQHAFFKLKDYRFYSLPPSFSPPENAHENYPLVDILVRLSFPRPSTEQARSRFKYNSLLKVLANYIPSPYSPVHFPWNCHPGKYELSPVGFWKPKPGYNFHFPYNIIRTNGISRLAFCSHND